MRGILFTIIMVCATQLVTGQSLLEINEERIRQESTGMLVLGSWAIGNLITNPILAQRAEGSQKYFYQMNAYWNIINLGIAGIGYYGLLKVDPSRMSFAETIAAQQKIEKLLLFNTGLDIAYMFGGIYLIERSKNELNNPERLKGFGRSILLQGAFLFSFDLAFYLFIHQHGVKIKNVLKNLSISPSSASLVFRF